MLAGLLLVAFSWAPPSWQEVVPGVWKTDRPPFAYVLVSESRGLLIGAPDGVTPDSLPKDVRCESVLLTHHHRDSVAAAAKFAKAGVAVRAPDASAAWLTPESVEKFWERSLPVAVPGTFPPLQTRFWGAWNYFVVSEGLAGVRCDLRDGETIAWRGWRIEAIATPGHSPDHFAFVARFDDREPICFCGDAFYKPGTMWTPFTLEWHHQKDDGLQAAAQSLRAIAARRPASLLPEHGPPITNARAVAEALVDTAASLSEAALLKNFDRYSQSRPDAPKYSYLAENQAGTANADGNPRPWTKLSPHLFLTGNTYAIASRDGPVLLVDPYAQQLPQKLAELHRDHGVGPVEAVLISHAHNDHYTGVFALSDRDRFQVWTLDRIADVIDQPWRLRAPYVDPRIPKVDRKLRDGETVRWREHELKIHHLPGQTDFAMGVEIRLDDRRCVFTGDHFFHIGLYSGTGGWSGRNRGLPRGYAATAQRLLDLRPAWILAEHGGAFEFHVVDMQRRRDWALASAAIADRLSPSGQHEHDWSEHGVRFEPAITTVKTGETCRVEVVVQNPTSQPATCRLTLARTGFAAESVTLSVPAGQTVRKPLALRIGSLPSGRYIVPANCTWNDGPAPADVFLVLYASGSPAD